MTLFRACLDLHGGQVKQIVGGSLDLRAPDKLKTNFESSLILNPPTIHSQPIEYYTDLYRQHELKGTHLIKLGPANDDLARRGLASWPHQIQVGGGITLDNAQDWLDAGASKVSPGPSSYSPSHHLTPLLPPPPPLKNHRLLSLRISFQTKNSPPIGCVNSRKKLGKINSCKRLGSSWMVAMNQWTTLTDTQVNQRNSPPVIPISMIYIKKEKKLTCIFTASETLDELSESCSEFLVHAADYEGLCQGIDTQLVQRLGEWARIPVTYAGGAKAASDLALVDSLSHGRVDLTFGRSVFFLILNDTSLLLSSHQSFIFLRKNLALWISLEVTWSSLMTLSSGIIIKKAPHNSFFFGGDETNFL
ncbi:uncharacterized protein VP01_2165g1 [Puccinia sorghi]|uniref:Uncharacterized protein n=1 Tax=Puccinia sorghi TaxID=27349 RepID=A0A0L6V9F8_9BASI|nr:uncharacterized protein VP01_2165g1 [Puccinia sorghi]